MKKYFKIGLVVVLAGLVSVGIYKATQKSLSLPAVAGTETTVSAEVRVKVGENFEKKIAYQTGMTALTATKTATDGKVITQGEGTEAYVVKILGTGADKTKREYWELLVNEQSALMGAGSLLLKPGDSILWKISKF